MPYDPFFDEPTPSSLTKVRIVSRYFSAWARIMATRRRVSRIGYIDLFSGPGRYRDGTTSTPLRVVASAIANEQVAPKLVSIFNDADEEAIESLGQELSLLPGIETLGFEPRLMNLAITDELISELEEVQRMIPSLTFIDPYGYKGLTLSLIERTVRDWGCETIFFFNYNRINAAIANPKVRPHMQALFTAARLAELQAQLKLADRDERPDIIFRHLGERIDELGGTYRVAFQFRRSSGRLQRSLIHVSKNPLAYKIMKGVMAGEGLKDADDVALFTFAVEDAGLQMPLTPRARPYLTLLEDLPEQFATRTLTRAEIFEEHNVGTPFVPANYLRALLELEKRGEISCDPPASSRRKRTMAEETVKITFPRLNG